MVNYIKREANYIREAANRNNEIWNHGSFEEELDYLIWWVEGRFDYFDENYAFRPFKVKTRGI